MSLSGFLYYLFSENKDALLALPAAMKTICTASIIISFGLGLMKSAMRLIKIVAIVAVVYFGAVYLRVI